MQVRPEVKIELDKTRTLYFDMNALVDFEAVTGQNFMKVDWLNMNVTILRALLWAGLHGEDKTLTLDGIGAMLSFATMSEMTSKIQGAIFQAVPQKKADESPLQTPPNGTG
jgi:hypothetical protein